jgi:N-acyl-D-amino-acid deacylase
MIRALLVVLISVVALAADQAALPSAFDVILRGGTVIDGTGRPAFVADVGIVGAHIAGVGDLSTGTAPVEIDARSLSVAPGFINLHSHASPDALATAENMLTQGVTTEILNPDGGGPIDVGAQLDAAEAGGLAVNIGANVGFNSAWAAIVGEADRRPTDEDVRRMREILTSNLERGAWGVSAGLDYKPAYFANVEEVVRVVEAAADWRTNFTNHDRLTPETKYSSRAAIAETMASALASCPSLRT